MSKKEIAIVTVFISLFSAGLYKATTEALENDIKDRKALYQMCKEKGYSDATCELWSRHPGSIKDGNINFRW